MVEEEQGEVEKEEEIGWIRAGAGRNEDGFDRIFRIKSSCRELLRRKTGEEVDKERSIWKSMSGGGGYLE